MPRSSLTICLILLAASVALVSVVVAASEAQPVAMAPVQADDPGGSESTTDPKRAAVELRHSSPMRVMTSAVDDQGQPVSIACSTCHAMLEPKRGITAADQLDLFHQGMHFRHGPNSCLSCHDPDDYDSLRLADGRRVPATASIELCSQCHGTQRRDFDRGAHGGMTGHWDLGRGGRIRNTCINCHDAHVPEYQGAIPAPAPRDRFQLPAHANEGAAP